MSSIRGAGPGLSQVTHLSWHAASLRLAPRARRGPFATRASWSAPTAPARGAGVAGGAPPACHSVGTSVGPGQAKAPAASARAPPLAMRIAECLPVAGA
jgi:hypothetical protein